MGLTKQWKRVHGSSNSASPLPLSRTSQRASLLVSQIKVVNKWHDMLDYTVKYLSPSCHHYRATWFKIFSCSRSFQWQNILLVIRLLFSVPVPNAVLEIFLSSLGRVKSIKRASLSQQTLEDILRIQAEGLPMECYDPNNANKECDRAKRRQPNQERKPTKKGSRQNAFISKKILRMNTHQKNLLRRVFLSAKSVETDQ